MTGAEVYAISLAHEQVAMGHRVLIVSDTLGIQTQCPYHECAIGKRSLVQRMRNIRFLIRLIARENVQIVHAHSRAASWVCNVATWWTGVAFISTVHGRQHLHFSSRSVSIYGNHVIAISDSLRAHLHKDLGIPLSQIVMIPNGVDVQGLSALRENRMPIPFPEVDGMKILLIVSRMSGPKGEVLRFLLRTVIPALAENPRFHCWIVGGTALPADFMNLATSVNEKHKRLVIEIEPFRHDIPLLMKRSDVILGSGRVALEGLSVGKPVIAIGESEYIGPIRPESLERGYTTNFGDTGPRVLPDSAKIIRDVRRILYDSHDAALRSQLQKAIADRYDVRHIARFVSAIYSTAFMDRHAPPSIPVLMYHRVVPTVPERTRHGIWVTADAFRRQMQSLRRRGITPVTFYDIEEFRLGNGTLPSKPIIITFDDGYEDNYTIAFPILKEMGFKAVIYMVMGSVPRTNNWDADEPQVPLMTHDMIRELADDGIEFGSHTMTHAHLTALAPGLLKHELAESRRLLESIVGREVISFAYPYAECSDLVKKAVAAAGYQYAVVGDRGPIVFHDDLMAIRRTQIFPSTTDGGFWRKTQSWYSRYKCWKTKNPVHQLD